MMSDLNSSPHLRSQKLVSDKMLYRIVNNKNTTKQDIIAQLSAVKELPATIQIYNRFVLIETKNELQVLKWGIEAGYFLCQNWNEAHDGRGRE